MNSDLLKKIFCFVFFLITRGAFASLTTNPRIAIILPLSGPLAQYGQIQEKGYQLAQTYLGRQNFRANIHYFDIGLSQNYKMVQEFVDQEILKFNPDIIIGPYSSRMAILLARALKKSKIPLLIPTSTHDSLTQKSQSNIYRLAVPSSVLAGTISEFLVEQKSSWSSHRFAVLAEESTFAEGVTQALKSSFLLKHLPNIKEITYKQGENFEDQLTGLQLNESSVLIVAVRSPQDAIKIMELVGEKTKIIGMGAGFYSKEVQIYAKKNKSDFYILSQWNDDSKISKVREFISEYTTTYKNSYSDSYPTYHSAQAYSALIVAGNILGQTYESNLDIETVFKKSLTETPIGQVRFINFSGYYQQNPAVAVVKHFQNGKIQTVFPQALSENLKQQETDANESSLIMTLLSNQIICLFVIIGFGLALGNIRIGGISLGSSGVLFVALLFGHFHFTIPSGVGTLGLLLFIYCVGLGAGRSFFQSLAKQGTTLVKLSIIIGILAAVSTIVTAYFFNIPADLAVGVFAGSMTSTPALAAALDLLKDHGHQASVGYGIAYPFGVILVVLFVQLLPRLLKVDLDEMAKESEDEGNDGRQKIVKVFMEVQNEALFGTKIVDSVFLENISIRISREVKDGVVKLITPESTFYKGQILYIVGKEGRMPLVASLIGKIIDKNFVVDIEKETKRIIVTNHQVIGKSIRDLNTMKKYGITISRITRHDIDFIPQVTNKLEFHDVLLAVGEPVKLQEFANVMGHRDKAIHETDIISLAFGIFFGIVLGMMPLTLPGFKGFSLGLSGGVLVTSLALSYFGRLGQIIGYVPPASRALLMELGLSFFLAGAGIRAGSSFVATLQEYGLVLFLMGAIITTVPLFFSYVIATYVLKMKMLNSLGGICGGMTSTPALGAITSKTDSNIPVICYATAYPMALIVMTVFSQIIIYTVDKF